MRVRNSGVAVIFSLLMCSILYDHHSLTHSLKSNTVAINPNGRNYASGAEDGYVRLHKFDKSYLDMKDPVPEADEEEKVAEE